MIVIAGPWHRVARSGPRQPGHFRAIACDGKSVRPIPFGNRFSGWQTRKSYQLLRQGHIRGSGPNSARICVGAQGNNSLRNFQT